MRSCSSLLDRYKALFDYYETFWNTECIYILYFCFSLIYNNPYIN